VPNGSQWTVAAHELRAEQAGILARILLETGEALPPREFRGSNGGDHGSLRGLPAIGRGVSGAIRGTDPLYALLHKEQGQRRR
jgi:hypothetical protein